MSAFTNLTTAADRIGQARERGAIPPPFDVSGSVDGLYPGASLVLPVELTNPYAEPIVVTAITVDVDDAGPNCPAELLSISDLEDPVAVDVGAVATADLVVTMDRAAPDACQGVTFPLHYEASTAAVPDGVVVSTTPSPSTATPTAAPGTTVAVPAPTGGDSDGSDPGDGLVPTGSGVASVLLVAAVLVVVGVLLRRHRTAPDGPAS